MNAQRRRPGGALQERSLVLSTADGGEVEASRIYQDQYNQQYVLEHGRKRLLVVRLDGEANTNSWSYIG